MGRRVWSNVIGRVGRKVVEGEKEVNELWFRRGFSAYQKWCVLFFFLPLSFFVLAGFDIMAVTIKRILPSSLRM